MRSGVGVCVMILIFIMRMAPIHCCSSSQCHSKCSFCTYYVREKDDGRFWIQIKKIFEKILEREEEREREREIRDFHHIVKKILLIKRESESFLKK